ncbi:Protein-lysine N-methyltransferase EFM3 [Yarrowia sp. C11]|nr:Protein-lysine N-methyltransferase EFM3 [Yarrowia sp. E02]KAG5373249.1 Protein-lysine N-methyltransferase EFM3 [Yarrowia sp. C11]
MPLTNIHHALSQQTPAYIIKPLLGLVSQDQMVDFLTSENSFLLKTLPRKYLASILKLFTRGLDEINDDLADIYAEALVPDFSAPPEGEEENTVSYKIDGQVIEIQEQRNVLSGQGGTGRRTWEAALALCEWLSHELRAERGFESVSSVLGNFDFLGEKNGTSHVVELGAGTGLSGLFLAKNGIKTTLTDGDDFVVQQLHHTIEANKLEEVCFDRRLFWGKDEPDTSEKVTHVIAADVTYDPSIAPELTDCLSQFAQLDPPPRMIGSATIRDEATYQTFLAECEKKGLEVRPLKELVPPYESEFVFLDPIMAPKVIIAEIKKKQ